MAIWVDKGWGNPYRNVVAQTICCWWTCGLAWWLFRFLWNIRRSLQLPKSWSLRIFELNHQSDQQFLKYSYVGSEWTNFIKIACTKKYDKGVSTDKICRWHLVHRIFSGNTVISKLFVRELLSYFRLKVRNLLPGQKKRPLRLCIKSKHCSYHAILAWSGDWHSGTTGRDFAHRCKPKRNHAWFFDILW